MELTIQKAMQRGLEAYKKGKTTEAYRYFSSILKTHPEHPDANHNMGILAIGEKKFQKALSFFKGPQFGQYRNILTLQPVKLYHQHDIKNDEHADNTPFDGRQPVRTIFHESISSPLNIT